MNIIRRIVKYLRSYLPVIGLSMLCSVVYSLFSGISLYLIIPLLETLFNRAGSASAAVPED